MTKPREKNKWQAKWIGYPYESFETAKRTPAPYFRKTFILEKKAKHAYLDICGLGYYVLYVNGKRIGNAVLNPPFARYYVSVLYSTCDIADVLVQGENTVGAVLGNGMYNMFAKNAWDYEKAPWRHHPKLILESEIVMEDDKKLLLLSDNSWKASFGPILSDNLW